MIFRLVVGSGVAYLIGSTPTGYLAGKLLKGIDIREHGSKSIGATNVLRTLGKWPALAVILVDVLKGVGAIVFAPLVLFLARHIAVGHAGARSANLGALGCLPGRTRRVVGA